MITIMIPVFNEGKIIENSLNRLEDFMKKNYEKYEILIVDDGSTDPTVQIIKKISKKNKKIRVVEHEKNKGIGAAMKTGFKNAKGDVIITMDSDLTYPPQYIPLLLEKMEEENADMVIGTPYAKGGNPNEISPIRFFLSRSVNLMDQILFGLDFTTPTSFFRAWKKKVGRTIEIKFDGFEAVSESAIKTKRKGYKIVEVPLKYNSLEGRISKINIFKTIKKHIEMDVKLLLGD